jgi:hypothetical protein
MITAITLCTHHDDEIHYLVKTTNDKYTISEKVKDDLMDAIKKYSNSTLVPVNSHVENQTLIVNDPQPEYYTFTFSDLNEALRYYCQVLVDSYRNVTNSNEYYISRSWKILHQIVRNKFGSFSVFKNNVFEKWLNMIIRNKAVVESNECCLIYLDRLGDGDETISTK